MKIILNEELYVLLFELNLLNEEIEELLLTREIIIQVREGIMSEVDLIKNIRIFNNFNLTKEFYYLTDILN